MIVNERLLKYLGDTEAYKKEVIKIRDFQRCQLLENDKNNAVLSGYNKDKGAFLGASSTSIITNCIFKKQTKDNNNNISYELKLQVEKKIPLIRFHNLKALMLQNNKYELLFEQEDDPPFVGIQRFSKVFNYQEDKLYQSILSKYDPNKISLNLYLKQSIRSLKYFPKQMLTIVKSVAESLRYLHQNDLCHGNVCLNNIFILKDLDQQISSHDIILCDPGMHYFFQAPTTINPDFLDSLQKIKDEKKVNEYQPVIRSCFNFIAPEMIPQINNNTFEPTKKSDVFQLGICMLCLSDISSISSIIKMLKNQSSSNNSSFFKMVDEINFSIKESDSIKRLLKQMLLSDPQERVSTTEIIKESEAILKSLETSQEMTELEKLQIANKILIEDNYEFVGQFEKIFTMKKMETIQQLKDITSDDNYAFSADQFKPTDLIRSQAKIVRRFNQNNLDFAKQVLFNQCERIADQQLKQNLRQQISVNKYRATSFNQAEQVMILIENNQLTRVNLFYYATQFEREQPQRQSSHKESKKNINDFNFEDPCSRNQRIMSCIFIDEEHFITVDSSLVLKLWNINLKKESVKKTEVLKGFQASSISLININRSFCAVHDKTQVHVYELVDETYEGGSYKFLGEKKELHFPDYQIKKILALPEYDEGLFLILTEQSQLIFCRTKNLQIVWEYSLLNIPQISVFFDNPELLDPSEIPIPDSDIFLDESSITPVSSQNQRDSSSYQTHSSFLSSQPAPTSNNMCSRISRMLSFVLPQQIQSNSRSSSRLSGHTNDSIDEEVNLSFDAQIGIIMDSQFFFSIRLKDLVRKQLKRIQFHCQLPRQGKYVSGKFHPRNKDVLIFITDEYQLIYFDYTNKTVTKSWHNSVNFLNLHIIPFQEQYYIFLTGAFKNNKFARIETDPYTNEDVIPF